MPATTNNPHGVHHPHDKFFKAVFKHPQHAREVLQALAPQALLNALRLDSLRLTDASFVKI